MDQCNGKIESKFIRQKSKIVNLNEIEMSYSFNTPLPITRSEESQRLRIMKSEGDLAAAVAGAIIYTFTLPKDDNEDTRRRFYYEMFLEKQKKKKQQQNGY